MMGVNRQMVDRFVTGHGSGWRQSRPVLQTLGERRKRPSVPVPAAARQQAAELVRRGYLSLDPGYPPELVAILDDVVGACEDPRTSFAMGGVIRDSVRYCAEPLAVLPGLAGLLTPQLCDLVRGWYGAEFRVTSIRAWRIAHIPDYDAVHHFGNLWHLDCHRVDILKLFVQTTPDVGTSAFRLVSTPDTRRALRSGYLSPEDIRGPARSLLDRRQVLFDAAPGQAMFVDTDRCLHRAGNPRPGETRGMVQLMFAPAEAGSPTLADHERLRSLPRDPNVYEGAVA